MGLKQKISGVLVVGGLAFHPSDILAQDAFGFANIKCDLSNSQQVDDCLRKLGAAATMVHKMLTRKLSHASDRKQGDFPTAIVMAAANDPTVIAGNNIGAVQFYQRLMTSFGFAMGRAVEIDPTIILGNNIHVVKFFQENPNTQSTGAAHNHASGSVHIVFTHHHAAEQIRFCRASTGSGAGWRDQPEPWKVAMTIRMCFDNAKQVLKDVSGNETQVLEISEMGESARKAEQIAHRLK